MRFTRRYAVSAITQKTMIFIVNSLNIKKFEIKFQNSRNQIEQRTDDINNQPPKPSPEEQEILDAELILDIREGCYQLAELGAWKKCVLTLIVDSKTALDFRSNDQNLNEEGLLAQKYLQIQLRLLYSVCYTMLEIIRHWF